MGGIAQLAKAQGYDVSGSDKAIYPPMSTQLEQAGISVTPYDEDDFIQHEPETVVVGNALSRGHQAVEQTLNAQQFYTSGPQWLAEHILKDRWVVAVAGTHGKTSTASMVAWILEFANLSPGFLIGGVPENFGVSARLGEAPFFVVEADEYDTAFFDKRSKFVHYHPRTCVLNNLEFDHADIFDSIKDIQKQFHHLVRTVPGNGLIVMPDDDAYLQQVIDIGCWTPIETQGASAQWRYRLCEEDGSEFDVYFDDNLVGRVSSTMTGLHNVRNALSAMAAAVHCGVPAAIAVEAMGQFKGIRRRMSLVGQVKDIEIYDDFAHHPTAIKTTLSGARKQMDKVAKSPRPGRLLAVFEPRSNTMRMGIHQQTLPALFEDADAVYAFVDTAWGWNLDVNAFPVPADISHSYEELLDKLVCALQPGDRVVIMSNGSFGGLHQQLYEALNS